MCTYITNSNPTSKQNKVEAIKTQLLDWQPSHAQDSLSLSLFLSLSLSLNYFLFGQMLSRLSVWFVRWLCVSFSFILSFL
jgi:hypothetical protein